jgi:ligand-binding sensor domain-containing protein
LIFNRRYISKGLLIAVLFHLISGQIYSQAYNFKQLSIQNGLPQSQAHAIIFDNHERAWIGTQGGGLCRYDGTEFIYFTKNDSLISNRVYSIYEFEDEIWVGQRGGVSVFYGDGRLKKNYRFADVGTVINDIIYFESTFYFATDKGLFELADKSLQKNNQNINLENALINKFFVDHESQLWLCTDDGLLNFKDPFNKINKARGLPVDEVQCALVFQGKILIGTYGAGLFVYDKNKGVARPKEFETYTDEIITTMFLDGSGDIWIGTLNSGVFVYSAKSATVKNYSVENGLANNHVRAILTDRWNNVWIGTSGGGISIFQNSPFVKYSSESGLNGNYIYAVLHDRNQNIWVSTEGGGVVRLNDTSATLFDEEFGFCSDKVRSIYEDSNGDIWFATESSGLGIFSPSLLKDTIVLYNQQSGLTSNWIKAFAPSSNKGETVIATINGGILKVIKNPDFPFSARFSRMKITEGKLPERINFLFNRNGELWFLGDETKYGFINNGVVKQYEIKDVNLRNAVTNGNKIWLGSYDNGILELTLKDDSIQSQRWITTADGLNSNNIYQLISDGTMLWIGTEKGIDKIQFDADFKIKTISHFGSAEGFEGVETNSNAGYLDRSGNLWFGTVNGLFAYSGTEINYAQKSPPYLMLNDFRIFYESIEKTAYAANFENGEMIQPLVLPYDMNHIGFSFKAIHYSQTANIRYRWKLSGVDRDWTPPSMINEESYGYLQPGKYTFSVKASIDDNWDVEPISVSFEIEAPYWQKWWFKLSYYSAIFLVILIVFLIVIFRFRTKNKHLREKLEMEKNLIELEQKALRLQMNPHFIFNVLNSIHNLIILNDPDKARYALAKFSKLMRRVLENSREKMISIDNEIETLENYVQLERLTSGAEVELEFKLDENLDPSEEILPPLMIQPFVENALIHGLKNLDKKGVIRIAFKLLTDHLLECAIEDNGRGREDAEKMIAQKDNYHKSTALKVTQERLASLNKNSEFIPFEIVDLKDENGNAKGTKIILRLEI